MIPALAAAALAGLIGSPHCIGMCGSFALACGGRVSHTFAWTAGRIVTYSTLGALAGLAGESVPGPTWVASAISAALVIWFAAALAGFAPDPALRIPGITRLATRAATRGDIPSRFVFGMANGLLPCGLVYATLGISVASGNPLTGSLVMAVFGLGTAPALSVVAIGVRRMTSERLWMRRIVAGIVLIAGLWAVAQRHGGSPHMGHDPGQEATPAVGLAPSFLP
jgi:sulfite exporter TauE/SafE